MLEIFVPRFVAGGLPPGSGVTDSQRLSGYLVRAAAGRCVCVCQCPMPLQSGLSSYLSSCGSVGGPGIGYDFSGKPTYETWECWCLG